MTQIAQVIKLLGDDAAEVRVHRQYACGHDCSDCYLGKLTTAGPDITIAAENIIGARPGDTVLLDSLNKDILIITVMIYLVPFFFFFIGYILSQIFFNNEGLSIVISGACFMTGFLPARWLDRRTKEEGSLHYRIIKIISSCSNI